MAGAAAVVVVVGASVALLLKTLSVREAIKNLPDNSTLHERVPAPPALNRTVSQRILQNAEDFLKYKITLHYAYYMQNLYIYNRGSIMIPRSSIIDVIHRFWAIGAWRKQIGSAVLKVTQYYQSKAPS